MRRKKKRLDVVETQHRQAALTVGPEGMDFKAEENLRALKKALSGVEGLCGYALPASSMLLRVTELPSQDAAELASMVELQVDKFSPFPTDQTQFSFEILTQQEGRSRVLIAAMKKEPVTTLGAALRHGGVILHRLDCRAVVWWAAMKEQGLISAHGRHTLLLLEAHDLSMLVAHHGEPVIFRSLGTRDQFETPEDCAELLDEVRFTLTALEAEWGSAEEVSLDVWSHEEVPQVFRAALEATHGTAPKYHRFEDLPPFPEALARRSAATGPAQLNLAPLGWLADEQYRGALRRLGMLSALFAGMWLMLMVALMVYMHLRVSKLDELQAGHAGLQEQAVLARELRAKVKSLQQYSDRTYSALEVLREVSVRLPAGVDLTAMNYKKGDSTNLKGTADEASPIHDFIAASEQSGLFTDVVADNIISRRDRDRVRTDFSIELKLPGGE
ncbi:MAG: hypothetical protein PHG65_04740 [Kiritimatiellae bacterium]|nr:hypothetical protein [Kiritimatiellia bacterium]